MIALVPVSLAYAIAAMEPCSTTAPIATLPETGATDVPVDVAPAAAFRLGDCGGRGTWSAVLTRTDDGEEVARTDDDDVEGDGLAEVFPDAELDPDTAYTLTLSDGAMQDVIGFTTGEGHAAALDGAPEVTDVAGTFRDGTLAVSASAEPAGDDDALLVFEEGGVGHAALAGADGTFGASWTRSTVLVDETCVVAVQRGLLGDRAESDEACADVRASLFGCSTSPVGPGLLGVLASLALARRR